jgi:hypothetical protein
VSTSLTAPASPRLHVEIVHQTLRPLLTIDHPQAAPNRYGFEGGRVIKQDGVYHLFTAEMWDDPVNVAMRLAHWRSPDGERWERVSTLHQSSGDHSGRDPRAALWAPMPVYDEVEGRWNLFYVAYHAAPDCGRVILMNHHGRIWRAVSEIPGRAGLGGPYRDVGVILQPDADSQPWEGLQGVDSFFPFQVGGRWFGFYGSARTEHPTDYRFSNGLAEAPSLAGPWTRRASGNPVPFSPNGWSENPIVTRLPGGAYVAVFDCIRDNHVALAVSADGLHWPRGQFIPLRPTSEGGWVELGRTPLGLIAEDDGTYTLFHTGFHRVGSTPAGATPPIYRQYERASLGRLKLRLRVE